jgi:glycosyltransferase involved in cell wall biosynthesis
VRILIVTQYFWPENFRINDVVKYLKSSGHHITVLTGYPNYPGGKIYDKFKKNKKVYYTFLKNVKIIRVPIIPRGGTKFQLFFNYLSFVFSASFFLISNFYKINFDAVLCYGTSPITSSLPGIIIGKLKKKPIFLWVLDLWPDTLVDLKILKPGFFLMLIKLIVQYIYNNCTLIFCQSKSFVNTINKNINYKVKTLYLPSWYEEIFIKKKYLKKYRLFSRKKSFNILFAGNIGEAQDFNTIVSCAVRLSKYPDIKWTVIGEGRKYADFIGSLKKNDILNKFSLLGQKPLNEMPAHYKKASVLLITLKDANTFSKTIPGRLQTCLISKKPIVAAARGETKRIIEESSSGLVANSGDYINLSRNILKFYKMTEKRRNQYGKNGYNYAKKFFNREIILSDLENSIKSNI